METIVIRILLVGKRNDWIASLEVFLVLFCFCFFNGWPIFRTGDWLIDWFLTAHKSGFVYFIPVSLGILLTVRSYLHILCSCFWSFFLAQGPIKYENFLSRSIWSMNGTLTSQSWPGSNWNEGVPHIPQPRHEIQFSVVPRTPSRRCGPTGKFCTVNIAFRRKISIGWKCNSYTF